MKLRLSDQCELFEQFYCVDFIKNDSEPEILELQPDILTFEPIIGSFGEASLSIERLRWDDVILFHDGGELSLQELSRWFQQWFDPQDERYDAAADLSGVIHSLLVQPDSVSIDLGTAVPEAFWDMLQLLAGAGAKRIRVNSSNTETPDDN